MTRTLTERARPFALAAALAATPFANADASPVTNPLASPLANPVAAQAPAADGDHDTLDAHACLQVSPTGQLFDPGVPGVDGSPEIPTGFASKAPVQARSFMVVAAHPAAAKTGCEILKAGGNAVDAAVAAQMVLGLVEPQSSGIGGGAFMLHFNADTGRVSAYDGRETAPAATTGNALRWISDAQRTEPLPNARASGRSIGTPGLVAMLDMAHRDAGGIAWEALFAPAIRIAEEGFLISPRMASSVQGSAVHLARDPRARAHFLQQDGTARPAGTRLRNPALAQTYRRIAAQGARAFYTGPIAEDIVATITDTTAGITPGVTTLADLAGYEPKRRAPVCIDYRGHEVCGMPPPSSGGLAVAQTLGILENFDLAQHRPTRVDVDGGKPTLDGVHLITEAYRLAFADRDQYVADTDFVPLPGGSPQRMLDKAYLRERAALIRMDRSLGTAPPGHLSKRPLGIGDPVPENGTTHLSIVDGQGHVVSLTATLESAFGSFRMTNGGFLLNNQLTDFSASSTDAGGNPIANRIEPGKRPRSSMAPTLVFRKDDGDRRIFVMATGSPGGAAIIHYVTKAIVGVLDWGLDAQQAAALVNFGSLNGATTLFGGEHPNVDITDDGHHDPLIVGLRARGHTLNINAQSSGVATIVVRQSETGQDYLEGGADPRREGIALGDSLRVDPRQSNPLHP